MVRRVTPSQLRSLVRQAESKQRQAINKINQGINKYNREVKRVVDNYNREVRAHNARVRADRNRLNTALKRLEQESRKPNRVSYTVQSRTVYSSYERLERRADAGYYDDRFNDALDLAEREAANSVELESALQNEPDPTEAEEQAAADPDLIGKLGLIDLDLPERWNGALYALSPRNPDAARHFCTSAREIFSRIFDSRASDAAVRAADPNCGLTERGTPTRRAKISYLLSQQQMVDETLEAFIDDDIENILSLFQVFNDGTHGSAGKYGMSQLRLIKTRVENGLQFLLRFVIP